MNCRRCGANIEDNTVFCPECGTANVSLSNKTNAEEDTARDNIERTVAQDFTVKEKPDITISADATVAEVLDKTVVAPVARKSSVKPEKKKSLLPWVVSASVIVVLLVGALLFKDDISDIFNKETTNKTEKYKVSAVDKETIHTDKTPILNEDITYSDAAGVVYNYDPDSLKEEKINTSNVLEYVRARLPELETAKAGVKISLLKDIVKTKDEQGKDIPYSENDNLNASINTLSKLMLITEPTTEDMYDGYVVMDKTGQFVVNDGETNYGEAPVNKVVPLEPLKTLTDENIKNAVCVDEGSLRVITITLQDAFPHEKVQNLYNHGIEQKTIKEAVLIEFDKTKDFIQVIDSADGIGVEYNNCQLVITINLETKEITAVEYIKRANITASVIGKGTLEGIKETPVTFCLESFLKYEITR